MNKFLPLLLALLLFPALPAAGAIEDLEFSSEQEHERYQDLIAELRCPKCLNANLAGSDAPIASDLRAEIYRQIQAGNSDEQIIDFMTARYGDFILYRPPLKVGTVLLWFGPVLLLLAGFVIIRRLLVSSAHSAAADDGALSEDEQHKLQALLTPRGMDKEK